MNTWTKHECNEIKRKISHQQKTIRQSVFNEDQSISDQSVINQFVCSQHFCLRLKFWRIWSRTSSVHMMDYNATFKEYIVTPTRSPAHSGIPGTCALPVIFPGWDGIGSGKRCISQLQRNWHTSDSCVRGNPTDVSLKMMQQTNNNLLLFDCILCFCCKIW